MKQKMELTLAGTLASRLTLPPPRPPPPAALAESTPAPLMEPFVLQCTRYVIMFMIVQVILVKNGPFQRLKIS